MSQLAVQRSRPLEPVERHPRREDDQQADRQPPDNSSNRGRLPARKVPDVGLPAQATPAEGDRREAEVDDQHEGGSGPPGWGARSAGPQAFRPSHWRSGYPYHASAALHPRTPRENWLTRG